MVPPEIEQCFTYTITHEGLEKISKFVMSKMRNCKFHDTYKVCTMS